SIITLLRKASMLVFFAAFKKEAIDLIRMLESRKTVKFKKTVIYDGTIRNKRAVICIMGMGKSNSLYALRKILKMKLENPVFVIQGISGAVADHLKIGDVVIYETVKNIEKFETSNNADIPTCSVPDIEEIKFDSGVINFDSLKSSWESYDKDLRILKSSGGLVPHVVTDQREKLFLNKSYSVEAIDMESYYIADIAKDNKIPVICVRSISDSLGEPISELIVRFGSGGFCIKIKCLISALFSRSETRSIISSYKNIDISCRNLNLFVKKVLLPYFGN
ncbi:MAG: 5'-methylthioadenosine/S-adenosylhomocysteine nucleosidase family protein, partial [Candidatus Humimicrobiaceae bacterium]